MSKTPAQLTNDLENHFYTIVRFSDVSLTARQQILIRIRGNTVGACLKLEQTAHAVEDTINRLLRSNL